MFQSGGCKVLYTGHVLPNTAICVFVLLRRQVMGTNGETVVFVCISMNWCKHAHMFVKGTSSYKLTVYRCFRRERNTFCHITGRIFICIVSEKKKKSKQLKKSDPSNSHQRGKGNWYANRNTNCRETHRIAKIVTSGAKIW